MKEAVASSNVTNCQITRHMESAIKLNDMACIEKFEWQVELNILSLPSYDFGHRKKKFSKIKLTVNLVA